MPNIHGADVRQSRYASKLASLEPEGATALALTALALLDAINAGKVVATNPDTRALLESLYALQDALYGAADTLPAAMAAFVAAAESGVRHD